MNRKDVAKAIDIHKFLDRLEESGNVQDYYVINHLTSDDRNKIALKIADSLMGELKDLGLRVDA